MRYFKGWKNEAGDNDSRALNINKDSLLQEEWKMLIKPVLLTIALTSKMATEPKPQLQIKLRNANLKADLLLIIQSEETGKSPSFCCVNAS